MQIERDRITDATAKARSASTESASSSERLAVSPAAAGAQRPAPAPQVYLHYDPYTKYQRKGSSPLERQRMDF
ncbi:hypothetical protein, partial [Rhodococcus sp. 02-925g]|uniref:hypothetical protein n=1 Tax=Rhodococcus sp. 02-925g TaxID=2022503 RepID=UPI001C527529